MNDIKQYFSSPTKLVASPSTGQPSSHSSQQTKKVNTRRESVYHTPTGSKSHASSTPRSSSTCSRKLIVSNMASVISSVEKQRKTKRKRDELKKRKQREQPEPDISNISNILSHKLHFVSPNAANGEAANVVSAAADMTNDLDGVELLEVMDVDNDSQLDGKKKFGMFHNICLLFSYFCVSYLIVFQLIVQLILLAQQTNKRKSYMHYY